MEKHTRDDRSDRFALVTAGHHFLLNFLPIRAPDSSAALTTFMATMQRIELLAVDVDIVLLRCLAILQAQTERRIQA